MSFLALADVRLSGRRTDVQLGTRIAIRPAPRHFARDLPFSFGKNCESFARTSRSLVETIDRLLDEPMLMCDPRCVVQRWRSRAVVFRKFLGHGDVERYVEDALSRTRRKNAKRRSQSPSAALRAAPMVASTVHSSGAKWCSPAQETVSAWLPARSSSLTPKRSCVRYSPIRARRDGRPLPEGSPAQRSNRDRPTAKAAKVTPTRENVPNDDSTLPTSCRSAAAMTSRRARSQPRSRMVSRATPTAWRRSGLDMRRQSARSPSSMLSSAQDSSAGAGPIGIRAVKNRPDRWRHEPNSPLVPTPSR